MLTLHLYHLPHTNFSSVSRMDFRDFQMFNITTLPVDHVSLKRLCRNFLKEANTEYLGELPEGTTHPLFTHTMQTAWIIQLEDGPNFPNPADIINYTTSALEAKPTSLNLKGLARTAMNGQIALNFFLDITRESTL